MTWRTWRSCCDGTSQRGSRARTGPGERCGAAGGGGGGGLREVSCAPRRRPWPAWPCRGAHRVQARPCAPWPGPDSTTPCLTRPPCSLRHATNARCCPLWRPAIRGGAGHHRRRGHLLHGRGDNAAGRARGPQAALQSLLVPGRGAQHRLHGPPRPRAVRARGRRPGRRGRADGCAAGARGGLQCAAL